MDSLHDLSDFFMEKSYLDDAFDPNVSIDKFLSDSMLSFSGLPGIHLEDDEAFPAFVRSSCEEKEQEFADAADKWFPTDKRPRSQPQTTVKTLVDAALQSQFMDMGIDRETKRARIEELLEERPPVDSALHQACCRSNVSELEVDAFLRMDPRAASTPIGGIQTIKPMYHPILRRVENRMVTMPYTYPLNLAIHNRASKEVIHMLIEAAPSVLGMVDGSLKETSLAILLKNFPDDLKTVDKMLLSNHKAAIGRDARKNTVTHVACSNGASLDVVRHLCIMNPESLLMRNFHRQTPLEISQRLTMASSDDVSSFLRSKVYEREF